MNKYNVVSRTGDYRRLIVGLMIWLLVVGLTYGCTTPQIHSTAQHRLISLGPNDLQTYGIAFITPSTVTGQEEEKQAVAFTFAEVLTKERPAIRCVTLSETLSAVNKAGLVEDYKRMFEDYNGTGLLKQDILQKIGEVTGTRYVAQLKLAGFRQGSKGRFRTFGLRILETEFANIRLFFQIWNTTDGSIVWEGVQELDYAKETFLEKTIALRTVLEEAAKILIARLP